MWGTWCRGWVSGACTVNHAVASHSKQWGVNACACPWCLLLVPGLLYVDMPQLATLVTTKLSLWWLFIDMIFDSNCGTQTLIYNSLWWRHNDHDSVSIHQPDECLLNRLFRRRSKKTSKLRVTGLCEGNSPGPVNSPHKGPVTRKMFPFDDVIISWITADIATLRRSQTVSVRVRASCLPATSHRLNRSVSLLLNGIPRETSRNMFEINATSK